ncbi:uncharacterized protein RAG0_01900 [Rhynchosporium agropyri]|uniref:Aminoglycoside phosphotransferase domain-containing protein n=1 Tax=Rhynchosporium agropyri TaxID=914238 RepID=A0A1E1JZA2_9HELO|nr:uncharacterized protein RAG0_01900 [Rhynchosporium agropyri]
MPATKVQTHSRLTRDRWLLGSSIICERVTTPIPSIAIISWQDGDGTFYLRERVEEDLVLPEDGLETGLAHEAGTSAAVWSIGVDAFCKVKAWREGMELESKTIEFVRRRALEIPVPEVIHTWIDHSWNRTFLILRRVKGQTLDEEWPRLTSNQRLEIGNKIAAYCYSKLLLGTLSLSPFLNSIADASHPSWILRPIGSFSYESFASYLSTVAPGSRLDVGDLFHFYHADIGPTNVMIFESTVTGILDWESAAYYPRFWLATKPSVVSYKISMDTTIGNLREGATVVRECLGNGYSLPLSKESMHSSTSMIDIRNSNITGAWFLDESLLCSESTPEEFGCGLFLEGRYYGLDEQLCCTYHAAHTYMIDAPETVVEPG